MDIAKYNLPLNITGGISGNLGGHKFKSGKAAKRLAPNSVHVCGFIWEWTQAKYNSPHDTPRYHTAAFGGVLGGSTILKPGKCDQTAGPIGNTFCTYNAGESRNGHR